MLRLFIAVNLRPEVNARLGKVKKGMRADELAWVKPENFHVTLKFIGNVESALVAPIVSELKACASCLPMTLQATGIGIFPGSGRKVGVIWAGIKDDSGKLAALAGDLDRRLAALGIAAERRPYSPHLTIARAPRGRHRIEIPREFEQADFGSSEVRDIVLYRSETLPTGVRYTPLAAVDPSGNVLT